MNDREKRDFTAGLEAEVDAFLRGEPTRRDFIRRFGQIMGMIPLSGALLGSVSSMALAQAEAEMADPGTPLGQAQAAAWAASTEGPADGSAYRAAEAAKQFSGVTLSLTYETGLQALDPRNFSGPMWEKLTGIKTNVVELAWPDLYSKAVAEHIAGSGAYDVLDVAPMWTPSLADGGVIQPLDDYIAKYMNAADLDDYHPLYKALPTYKGKIWGFFDDGDIFALYYRKDIFEDPKLTEAYQAEFGTPLAPPKTWEEYIQIAQFITDNLAPNVYGAGHFRKAGSPGNQFDFLQQFRANGGQLFDENMKAALASDAGVKTLENMIAANNASIPGNNELDAVSLWAAFLTGKVAMIYSWPPSGRMSAGYSQTAAAINFIPQSQIAGKVGYAVVPGNPEHATGFNKALGADSANPDAAYLMMQWMTSPPVSLARVMLPYALRDPYRLSHFTSELYAGLWPDAKAYLVNLNNSANVGLLDPIIPGAQDYFLSIDRMATSVWAGADPKQALETAAAEWDATTDRLGAESQKAYYTEFLKLPGATADNTVEKLGMAVNLGG
jgi:multiple sugar transport system substrate-binding protein